MGNLCRGFIAWCVQPNCSGFLSIECRVRSGDSGNTGVRSTAVLALPGALSVRDRTVPCVRRLGRGWRGGKKMEVEQEEGSQWAGVLGEVFMQQWVQERWLWRELNSDKKALPHSLEWEHQKIYPRPAELKVQLEEAHLS